MAVLNHINCNNCKATLDSGVVMIFSFNPDLLNKKGTKCGPFTEKNRPTQEVQHLISSFWAGPRRIWDQKLIFYGSLCSGPFSEGRFRVCVWGGGGGGGMPLLDNFRVVGGA